MGEARMLKRLMIGVIVGFYCAEWIDSEFAPALRTILRYFRDLVCVLYAFPAVDLADVSQGRLIPSIVHRAEEDGPLHGRTRGN